MNASDLECVAELLGHPPRGECRVVTRASDGRPVVIQNAPLLDDGTPMPTLYWLVGRPERELVSRLEAAGGVKEAAAAVDPGDVEQAHRQYAALREAALARQQTGGGSLPSGGVGGTRVGVKCLHAHLAWWLAGGPDPVGSWTADRIGLGRENYRLERSDDA